MGPSGLREPGRLVFLIAACSKPSIHSIASLGRRRPVKTGPFPFSEPTPGTVPPFGASTAGGVPHPTLLHLLPIFGSPVSGVPGKVVRYRPPCDGLRQYRQSTFGAD